MLQTVESVGYKESKEYALKQDRAIRNERASGDTQGADKAGTEQKTKASAGQAPYDGLDHLAEKEGESKQEQGEWALALQRKGKGNGINANCLKCGKQGHRAAEWLSKANGKDG